MDIPFLGQWRKRHAMARGFAVYGGGGGEPDATGLAELLGECELLRVRAGQDGVELDGSAASLSALDQLVPSWRSDPDDADSDQDPDLATWLGNDAGLYLGTVIVGTVPGAAWQVWPNGHPVVRLASGRELDTVQLGHTWAESGSPELSQVLAEASED